MARPSEHKLNRHITQKLSFSRKDDYSLRANLARMEYELIYDDIFSESKQLERYNICYESAAKILENHGEFFEYNTIQNPPTVFDAIKCISYFLDFRVTSDKQIVKYFGDDILDKITQVTGICSFKDNLNSNCSDKVILFNIALLYTINVTTEKKEHSIPFFMLNEIYNPITTITFNGNRTSFLFEIYKNLVDISVNTHISLFSSIFVSLYRAYEKYAIPSIKLSNKLTHTRRKHEQAIQKYSDEYIKTIKSHVKDLKQAQKDLLLYIKDNILYCSNLIDIETDNIVFELDKHETLELLSDIKDKFSTKKPSHSLSAKYFFSSLININSDETLRNVVNVAKSLFTINDCYVLQELSNISFHVLGKHPLEKVGVTDEILLEHLNKTAINDNSVLMLAEFLYSLSDMSNIDYLLFETFIYSANLKSNEFYRIYNMILSYNPIP